MFTRSSHLGDHVVDYVDGLMSPAEELRVEQHLVTCQMCLASVEQERAIIAKLQAVRVDAGRHQQLMAGLLQLATTETGCPNPTAGRAAVGAATRPAPAVLATGAPAQYHSARRSVGVAIAAAAGCFGVALVAGHAPVTSDTTPAQVRFSGGAQPALTTVVVGNSPRVPLATQPTAESVRLTLAARGGQP